MIPITYQGTPVAFETDAYRRLFSAMRAARESTSRPRFALIRQLAKSCSYSPVSFFVRFMASSPLVCRPLIALAWAAVKGSLVGTSDLTSAATVLQTRTTAPGGPSQER
jgi:hypothetical protein